MRNKWGTRHVQDRLAAFVSTYPIGICGPIPLLVKADSSQFYASIFQYPSSLLSSLKDGDFESAVDSYDIYSILPVNSALS